MVVGVDRAFRVPTCFRVWFAKFFLAFLSKCPVQSLEFEVVPQYRVCNSAVGVAQHKLSTRRSEFGLDLWREYAAFTERVKRG